MFDDIGDYVRDFVSPLYYGDYNCISYQWSPTFWDASDAIYKFNKDSIQPNAVIMNMGMHSYQAGPISVAPELNNLIKATDANTKNTRYILHSVTSQTKHKKSAAAENKDNNEKIFAFNAYIQSRIKDWKKLDVYLDFWQYDLSLSAIKGCKHADGLHFERMCNYQPLISQW